MRRFLSYIFLISLTVLPRLLWAQDDPVEPDEIEFIIERSQPITIDLEEEEEEEEDARQKKKKPKKNVFYGIKTKKGFTKTGYGDNTTVEIFHYLKEWIEPDPYVPDIYWFDFRRKRIRNTGTIDKKYGRILHGPYTKIIGGQLIEQGIYYIGTKHGRWIRLDKNDILVEKMKYFKGWPKESLVKFYDDDRQKLKEVIPVVYGEVEGDYYFFHENGEVAVRVSTNMEKKSVAGLNILISNCGRKNKFNISQIHSKRTSIPMCIVNGIEGDNYCMNTPEIKIIESRLI
jgi:hypothetical protein